MIHILYFQRSNLQQPSVGTKNSPNGRLETENDDEHIQKNIIKTSPQARLAKRLHLEGVKHLKANPLRYCHLLLSKAQGSQNEAETQAKIRPPGTQNHKDSKKHIRGKKRNPAKSGQGGKTLSRPGVGGGGNFWNTNIQTYVPGRTS